tara:strand:+ start:2201 stop:2668 length:468 start_codon:yes stop_codon:yes gene_type:complete
MPTTNDSLNQCFINGNAVPRGVCGQFSSGSASSNNAFPVIYQPPLNSAGLVKSLIITFQNRESDVEVGLFYNATSGNYSDATSSPYLQRASLWNNNSEKMKEYESRIIIDSNTPICCYNAGDVSANSNYARGIYLYTASSITIYGSYYFSVVEWV